MEVEVLVDETDIRNVALGAGAEVRVDALQDVKIAGEVTEIGSSAVPRGVATGTNQAKDFKVTITLKDPPTSLRPGLNATADITTAQKKGVLSVPIQAVVVRTLSKEGKIVDPSAVEASDGDRAAPPEKGDEKEGVFVMGAGLVSFRPVKTGILGDTEIEITSGLSEGDEIVTGSYKTLRTLKDGARVKVETKETR
jgi:HlyD family secretion protein